MNKGELKRLGDYIREVDVRNRNLEVTKLVGLTIDKLFIPSVANVIGTDLSKYKIIREKQFACSLMQVSRDEKMPIAMLEEKEAIISPAYPMFEVVDTTKLLPEYLMMWFSRKEFDREASFYAVGGVRGSLTWDDFCNLTIPIPPIEKQQKIVSEYEAVTHRIRLNEQIIAKLEETAQTLYRKMFVDGFDKENLPEEWRMGTLGEICEVNPKTFLPKGECCNFIEMENIPTKGFFIKSSSIRKYNGGSKFQNGDILFARITPCLENGKVGIVQNLEYKKIAAGSTEFIVLRGKKTKLTSLLSVLARNKSFREYAKSQMKGTDGRQRVDAQALLEYNMYLPINQKLIQYEKVLSTIVNLSLTYSQENYNQQELQSLLLAKMGQ